MGDDLEGWYSERRFRMVVNAYTEAAIIDDRAMTSAKSPSLRLDESVVTKPIPAILCCPGWDDAKGVNATCGDNEVTVEVCRELRQMPAYCVQRTSPLRAPRR